MDLKQEFINPWQVTSKDDFLFYCCPECDMKSKDYDLLYEHAVESHELAKQTLVRHSVTISAIKEEYKHTEDTEVNELVETFIDEPEEPKVKSKVPRITPSSGDSNEQWQCYYCGECYEDRIQCRTHVQNKHNATDQHMRYGKEVRSIQCSVCSLMFKDENMLKIHVCGVSLWYENGCKYFKCPECSKEFPAYRKLARHYALIHTQEKKFKCDKCDYRTFTNEKLNEHLVSHEVSLTCDICRKRFKSFSTLKKHNKIMHEKQENVSEKCDKNKNVSKHMCHICGLEFQSSTSISNHMASHHQTVTTDLICDKCGKGFPTKNLLYKHNYFNHRQKVFICTICERAFPIVTKLTDHLRTEHEIVCSTSDIFSCDQCKSTFSNSKELNSHLQSVHSLENVKSCEECDTSVTTHALLQCHKIEAHAFNPFEPKVSEESKTKNFKCDICNLHLKSRRTLAKHIMEKHRKDSHNIKCDQCSFKTYRNSLLNQHKQIKHEGKRKIYCFTCSECSKTFTEKRYLRKHLIEEHNITDQVI